jgi:hypothetical protein
MDIESFFKAPSNPRQKQYEALRAYYLEKIPLEKVLRAFGFTLSYFKKLCRESMQAIANGQNPFFMNRKPGPKTRFTHQDTIHHIVDLRKKNYSIADIQAILCAKEKKLSLSCINNLLKDEGFAPLPRRTRQERRKTVLPETLTAPTTETLSLSNEEFSSERGAGSLVFLPLLEQLGIVNAIEQAGYPGTSKISATSYVLSFLSLKIIGNQRYGCDEAWNLDRGLGLFAGLNVLPKTASLSSYSYRVTREMNRKFLVALSSIFNGPEPEKNEFNLDFKTIPH